MYCTVQKHVRQCSSRWTGPQEMIMKPFSPVQFWQVVPGARPARGFFFQPFFPLFESGVSGVPASLIQLLLAAQSVGLERSWCEHPLEKNLKQPKIALAQQNDL